MTPRREFDALTRSGQSRRLRVMAARALTRYPIHVREITLLANAWNTLFQIRADDGRRYVLRINRPDVRTWLQIHSELTWMDALHRDADITIPVPVQARDGTMIQTVEAPGVPEARHCVLFTWVGGRSAATDATPRTVALLGQAMATLHDHADHFHPSEPFSDTTARNAWPSGRPGAIYGQPGHPSISAKQRHLVQQMAGRVQRELDSLYLDSHASRFLHADMHLLNTRLLDGSIAILDFDDSLWCHPVQDAGISFFYLLHYPDHRRLRAALVEGYARRRTWPASWDQRIESFVDARLLNLIDVFLRLITDQPAYLQRLLRLAEQRSTGILPH